MSSSSFSSTSSHVSASGSATANDCAWEQVTAKDSCYTQPRSCYNCLNSRLSSGQECVLTPFGLCESSSAYDYTKTIAVLNPPPHTQSTTITSQSNLTKPATKDTYAADDECMWYQNSTLCETPRTCYDCLNTALYSGQKCAITPGGYCTTIEAFDFALDYRRVHSDSAAHFFPSTNTTYCEDDDVACAKCRAESFVGAYSGKTNLSAYCTGASDCVCVAFCESPNWKSIVVEEACEAIPTANSNSGSSIPSIAIAGIIVVGLLLAMSAIFQLCNMFRVRQREVRWHNMLAQSIAERRRPPTGLTLELSAWKEMHNGLIADERNDENEGRLADVPDDAPMVTSRKVVGTAHVSQCPVLPAAPPSPNRSSSTPTLSQTQRVSI
ncbi:hypothetical protein PInf_024566 [Phytophthora infestans]|nr:hypothetical protein PInf_024566 [Phytophthora infestans]